MESNMEAMKVMALDREERRSTCMEAAKPKKRSMRSMLSFGKIEAKCEPETMKVSTTPKPSFESLISHQHSDGFWT